MVLTQAELDRAALVVVIGEDGLFEWSSTKSTHATAAGLRWVADAIEAEEAAAE